MSLGLHNLKAKESRSKKRVGRGNASGHGTYSTRGLKGQKCRSGVTGLKRMGLKKLIISTPKLRGFKSHRPKAQVLKISTINENFKNGSQITLGTLARLDLIKSVNLPVKVLCDCELKIDNLTFSKISASKTAVAEIEKHKGKMEVVKKVKEIRKERKETAKKK